MVITITAKELCTRAMRLAGYLGAKATPKAEDMEIAFHELQGLIDIWHAERLMDLYDESYTHSLPAGSPSFTIGLTGDIVADDVPVSINSLRIKQGDHEIVLRQRNITDMDRSGIGSNETSNYPSFFAYQVKDDIGTVILYPKPSSTLILAVGVGHRIPIPVDENAEMIMRNGWYQTTLYCLADNLQIPLNIPQGEFSAKLTANASSYKTRLKAARLRVAPPAKIDACVLGGRYSSSRRGR